MAWRSSRPWRLGSWLAFKSMGNDVMVMGDLVLTADEVNPVLKRLEDGGVEVTALHNHLLRASPATMYMHVHGHGAPTKLATTLREALGASKTPFGAETAAIPPQAATQAATTASTGQKLDLDTAAIDQALGRKGKVNGGVYQVSVPRAEMPKDSGMEVPEAMGSAIAINFQPTGSGKAAITGDFVLTADEVNPVVRALHANGIEVTAIHNHMLNDEPRLFFMHFWANDDAQKLAKGLRAALDQSQGRRRGRALDHASAVSRPSHRLAIGPGCSPGGRFGPSPTATSPSCCRCISPGSGSRRSRSAPSPRPRSSVRPS